MIKRILFLIALFMCGLTWANLPFHPIQFPRDEAGHYQNVPYPVKNMMEWWYYNGTVKTKTGRTLGYYLSFNYIYIAPNHFIPFLQVQVSDVDKQKVYGKHLYFVGEKNSSISTEVLDVKFGKDFTLRKENETYQADGTIQLEPGSQLKFSLHLTPKREAVLIGENGLIDMTNNTNSYYYSHTRLKTEGYFQINKEVLEIDPAESLSWMDHQWGDFLIVPGRDQWMWTSIQLENNLDINLFVRIDKKTKEPVAGMANIFFPDGSKKIIQFPNYSYLPRALTPGDKHPLTYDLSIPDINLNLILDALVPGQDVNGIWEGVSAAQGKYKDVAVKGQAYTENTVKY